MSYESEIKKVQKMWDKGQDLADQIAINQTNQDKKQNQADYDIAALQNVVNNLTDLGGGYKPIKTLMALPYTINGFDWTISYTLPEWWIPQIRLEVAYNYNGNAPFDKVVTYLNKVISVVPAQNGFVTATWLVNWYLVCYDPTVIIPDFSAKLYFVLIDPSRIV